MNMAFIERRPGRKGVYVYYHDKDTGKQRQIPRKLTKHLDNVPPEEAAQWVSKWESDHGIASQKADIINLKSGDRLSGLWEQYQVHRKTVKKRRNSTASSENKIFYNHIVPFFVGKHNNKKPESWHDLVPAFHAYLFNESKLKDQSIRYVLWALERFGKWLVWSRKMFLPFAIDVPSRENTKTTPLKVRLDPKEVLDFAKRPRAIKSIEAENEKIVITEQQVRLSILLGYFAGLRPSEQWALDKSDFITGSNAEKHTKTLPGLRSFGLGSKLSISVNKTWQKEKGKRGGAIVELTKSHYSKGVVNVWDKDAALIIAELLKNLPDGRIFPATYYGMFQAWRKRVKPWIKVTAHDLRRASGLYLGRVKRIDLLLLQSHMRHAEIETTMLYTREPEVPDTKIKGDQDFDDVV